MAVKKRLRFSSETYLTIPPEVHFQFRNRGIEEMNPSDSLSPRCHPGQGKTKLFQ